MYAPHSFLFILVAPIATMFRFFFIDNNLYANIRDEFLSSFGAWLKVYVCTLLCTYFAVYGLKSIIWVVLFVAMGNLFDNLA